MKTCWLYPLFFISLFLHAALAYAEVGTGLEIDNAENVNLVLTLEPEEIDTTYVKEIVSEIFSTASLNQKHREDAQLFLRVEKQQSEYLLYLDFSRTVRYNANGKCFTRDGFVWGRYVKEISDLDDLYDDIQLLIEDFVESYTTANQR
jgi:hypothetical protein